MRIGFDASPLHRPHPPGIVRLVGAALDALEARRNIDVVRLAPEPGEDLRRWRHRDLPRRAHEERLFGIHSFLSSFPRRGPGKRVHTVHELPWKHGVEENADWRHRYWAGFGGRRASAVITGTEFVARELRRSIFVRNSNVHVVPWAVSEATFSEEPPPGVVDETVPHRYRLPESALVIAPGAVREKKNLDGLLRGLNELKQRRFFGWHLVVTGEDTRQLRRDLGTVSRLGLARYVSTPGSIPEADWPSLLRTASAVCVLSRSEGFSLPVLEALACGTPIVVAADTAQAEVAGEQGIVCDPTDPTSIADAVREAIDRREELRYCLPERAHEFTWDRTAAGIEDVWKSLAS